MDHPILDFSRDKRITFYFNDKKLHGFEGETIAAALHASKITTLSKSNSLKRPRGFFCGIGKCSSCLMKVNNIPNVRTCLTKIEDGMKIETDDRVLPDVEYPFCQHEKIECDILIIGGGPAGMNAALEAMQHSNVVLIDENNKLGGQLIKQTHKFFGSKNQQAGTRGITIAQTLEKKIADSCNILLDTSAIGYYFRTKSFVIAANKLKNIIYEIYAKKIIFATGAQENMLAFENNDLPGIYGAGGIQTIMNVYGIKPGTKGLIVGAGNVGLIVAYQLMQAGVDVVGIVEALPTIGGYFVHAAKVRRLGIPILTRHTILQAVGADKVEGAIVAKLDANWNVLKGSECELSCDFICLAVGLTPASRLVAQTGADISFVSGAGGWIALHNEYMETTKRSIYVSGDLANIEEASTAMIEGKIAGLHASHSISSLPDFKSRFDELQQQLSVFRKGYFGDKPFQAKKQIYEGYNEAMEQ